MDMYGSREDYCFLLCGLFLENRTELSELPASPPRLVSSKVSLSYSVFKLSDEFWNRNRGKRRSVGGRIGPLCSATLSMKGEPDEEVMSKLIPNANRMADSVNDGSVRVFFPASEAVEDKEKNNKTVATSTALNTSKHLWAGAVAAMVSRTFIAPLERMKLEYVVRGEKSNLLHLVKRIATNEGVKGFWKGNFVNILRTAPFKAINFYAYDTYRGQLMKFLGNKEATNFERFVAGAAAGITATVICLPMDTIRTILVAPGGEALGGVIGAFRHMIQTEGFLSLYKGLLPSILSMAPSGAVFYGVYDILKSAYLHSPEGKTKMQFMKQEGQQLNPLEQLELGPFRTLLYGAVAGCCSEAATYPFEVVRRQLQLQAQATKMNAWKTSIKIIDQGGIPALYSGLLPSLLQVLPSAAISYFVYEFMKILLRVE